MVDILAHHHGRRVPAAGNQSAKRRLLGGNRVFGLNPHKPTLDWKAASWLLPYLLGMGVIVYVSDFGPVGAITFGWDMLVVAVWSLIIFYWAVSVSLSKEKIEEMLGEVVDLEEEGMEPVGH